MNRRLLSLARDVRGALAATILSGFLAGALAILQAFLLSRTVSDVFLDSRTLADVTAPLRWLLIVIGLRACLTWAGEGSAGTLAVRVKENLRLRLFSKIVRLGPAYTRGERTGELAAAAVEGVETLHAYFSQYLPQLALAALVPLSILIAVFPRDLLSGFILLLTAPLIPVFMILIGKAGETLTRRQWNILGRLSAHFLDSLQGLTTLKQLGCSREHASTIDEAGRRFRDVTLGVLRVTFLSALVLELVATISTAVVAVEVGLRLLYGHMVFQEAFFLLLLAPEFYLPLRMLGMRFHAGMSGAAAAQRIFGILDLPEARHTGPQTPEAAPRLRPSKIGLSHVSFTYPGESRAALQDIDLEIKEGEHVALVGPSGAGKSTLADLLLGFIEPERGLILVDGRPLSGLDPGPWRAGVAWVPQQPYLFHDTLAANLCLGRPEAGRDEIAAALRAAALEEVVAGLPHGCETLIGEEGLRLSSGQAQRLALARAFLKNTPILILDEPTSSLDPENEALFDASIERLMKGRTVITIAHRLPTVYRADRIFVLDKGCLVAVGKHAELLRRGGIYARLVGNDRHSAGEKFLTTKAQRHQGNPGKPDERVSLPGLQESRADSSPSIVLRLLSFLHGARGWVALSVLLGVLTVGSNIGLLGTSAYLISAAALHPDISMLGIAIVGVRFFGITRGVFRYLERLVSHNVTFRLLARLRAWFFRALEPLAPARLMQFRSGDLLSRTVADVDVLENFYVRVVSPPLVAVLVAAGTGLFLARFDLRLALAFLLFIFLGGAGLPWLAHALARRSAGQLAGQRAGLHTLLVDNLRGLADLVAFGREGDALGRLRAAGEAAGLSQVRLAWTGGFTGGLALLLTNLGWWAALALTIPLVGDGRLAGVLIAPLTLIALASFEAVQPLPLAVQMLADSLQAARRLFEIVDARPAVSDPAQPQPIRDFEGLAVRDLQFSYGPGDPPALDGISFDLPPGRRLAVVGPSGSGKTTLVNLLQRFWEYSSGRILLSGTDLRSLSAEEVRRRISLVPQRVFFFNDSIRWNLLLARPGASDAELAEAARQAGLDEFIRSLPQGFETVIGERGFRLSGGERQRLAIARALLRKTPLLVLDEPTASLDPLTERRVLEVLLAPPAGRSLLLITHRLVGLEAMDEILVLDHGRIVERGREAELLAAGGNYRHMWELQHRFLADAERS